MRSPLLALAAALSLGASFAALPADAASRCRDATGKFIACPPPPAAKTTACRGAGGRFVKCAPKAAA